MMRYCYSYEYKKISILNLKSLIPLLENNYVPYSSVSNKKFLSLLEERRAVKIEGKPKAVCLINKDRLINILNNNGFVFNDVEDIKTYIKTFSEIQPKDVISKNNANTKSIESKSFNGLTVNCFNRINLLSHDEDYELRNIKGGGIFLHYSLKITLPSDIIIVGVENPQTIWYIDRYKYLFKD